MRLVVTGPVGAGKSTFIRSISEIEVVETDQIATDATGLLKRTTTVALDYGRLQFSPTMAIHLYGTPGQSRFDFMWDVLVQRAHAYILLVPANRPAEFRNAKLIHCFMQERSSVPMIVGITHNDYENAWRISDIKIALGFTNESQCPPFVTLNAMNAQSVAETVLAMVSHCLQLA